MARILTENNETFLRSDWFIEDVRNVIECNNIEAAQGFADEDCVKVLEIVARSHDANVGVNWEVLGCAVDHYLQWKTK